MYYANETGPQGDWIKPLGKNPLRSYGNNRLHKTVAGFPFHSLKIILYCICMCVCVCIIYIYNVYILHILY